MRSALDVPLEATVADDVRLVLVDRAGRLKAFVDQPAARETQVAYARPIVVGDLRGAQHAAREPDPDSLVERRHLEPKPGTHDVLAEQLAVDERVADGVAVVLQ